MSPSAVREVVLVVDDAPQSLGALCAELEAEGYTVLMAPTANQRCSGWSSSAPTPSCSTR